MKYMLWMLMTWFPWTSANGADLTGLHEYYGMCDASAVVAVQNGYFLAANDEDNTLRLYERDGAREPVKTFKLDSYLQVTKKQAEADIEGSARIGDLVYWIASHGNNKSGEPRPNRQRFFATRLIGAGADLNVEGVGTPCQDALMAAITRDSRLADCRWREITALAPEQPGALNIEGLASTPAGTLWIAFRNPIPQGRALLVELKNPREVLDEKTPVLGRVARLNLEGGGIRSIEYCDHDRSFVIISGPTADDGDFHLWKWSGDVAAAPIQLSSEGFSDCTPEAATFFPDRPTELFVLSDDGSRDVGGEDCKDAPKKQRHFRGGWLPLPAASK